MSQNSPAPLRIWHCCWPRLLLPDAVGADVVAGTAGVAVAVGAAAGAAWELHQVAATQAYCPRSCCTYRSQGQPAVAAAAAAVVAAAAAVDGNAGDGAVVAAAA